MPLYGFRCDLGHETVFLRSAGDKHASRCSHDGCRKITRYSFADSVVRTVDAKSGENWFGEKERGHWYAQTGKVFNRARDFDAWCKASGKEVIRSGDNVAAKMRAQRLADTDATTHQRCRKIWQDVMTS